jgi:peptidyl-tRNA hydrolase
VAHAALDFALAHPLVFADWHHRSNTLVVLAAPDELELGRCHADAVAAGLLTVAFHEPDLSGALTAIALSPAPTACSPTSHSPSRMGRR